MAVPVAGVAADAPGSSAAAAGSDAEAPAAAAAALPDRCASAEANGAATGASAGGGGSGHLGDDLTTDAADASDEGHTQCAQGTAQPLAATLGAAAGEANEDGPAAGTESDTNEAAPPAHPPAPKRSGGPRRGPAAKRARGRKGRSMGGDDDAPAAQGRMPGASTEAPLYTVHMEELRKLRRELLQGLALQLHGQRTQDREAKLSLLLYYLRFHTAAAADLQALQLVPIVTQLMKHPNPAVASGATQLLHVGAWCEVYNELQQKQ